MSTIKIGDDVIANAGTATSGKYAHLLGYIGLPTPTVTGTPVYGHTLTVHLAPWASKGVKVTYQWYRNGVPITGRTGTTNSLNSGRNINKMITVRVTATRLNYVTESLSSVPLHIR